MKHEPISPTKEQFIRSALLICYCPGKKITIRIAGLLSAIGEMDGYEWEQIPSMRALARHYGCSVEAVRKSKVEWLEMINVMD